MEDTDERVNMKGEGSDERVNMKSEGSDERVNIKDEGSDERVNMKGEDSDERVNMKGEGSDERVNIDSNKPNIKTYLKTNEGYRVNNLPTRFNNPDCFNGYSKKKVNPLYQTTNQTYGSRKPTVHEMPTTFHGSCRKFSEQNLKSGMYRDNGFNTALEKSQISGSDAIIMRHNRILFQRFYHDHKSRQANSALI